MPYKGFHVSGWWLQDEYKAERGAVIAAGGTPVPIFEVLKMIKAS